MSRLRTLDRVLLGVLVPVWSVCFVLHIHRNLTDRLFAAPIYVSASESPKAYPRLDAQHPFVISAFAELLDGDTLVRVGERDLTGVGPFWFEMYLLEQAGKHGPTSVELGVLRQGQELTQSISLRPWLFTWRYLPLSLAFAGMGVLVLLRAPGLAVSRPFFLASTIYSLLWLRWGPGSIWSNIATIGSIAFALGAAPPLALRAAILLPERRLRHPGWARILPWSFALLAPAYLSYSWSILIPSRPAGRLTALLWVAFGTALLVVLSRGYYLADPIGRRRIKWFLYGFWVGALPVIVADVWGIVDPRYWWVASAMSITLMLIPICCFLAIVRYNFLDIDRAISVTASYTLLSVLAVAGLLALMPRASQAASTMLGIESEMTHLVIALILAGIVVPAHRRLRPWLDRIFFAERYRLEQGVERLLRELATCADMPAVVSLVADRIQALVPCESCAVYVRATETFVLASARGRGIPPALSASSAWTQLAGRTTPVGLLQKDGRELARALPPADAAALASFGAGVLIPLQQGEELAALVCIGSKLSGDVFTATDRALFAAVAERASSTLVGFDQRETLEQARSMQAALRRYVPGAVAEEIERQADLVEGPREVSVLFVDIRSYTSLAELYPIEEIFSTVNRYTKAVSEVVRRHGGSVVEFHGDGLMAVFGAPRTVPHKEASAVTAAREVVSLVETEFLVTARDTTSVPLTVGVGIATGDAFVGNIRAVDRDIWSVIGNTTNLAARLQALTRELDAWIAIDATTHRRAERAAADFELNCDLLIRGLSGTLDVFALSRAKKPESHERGCRAALVSPPAGR